MPREPDLDALLREAERVRGRAHAPYSRFPVGAAVLASGHVFAACNVENSSYPLSMCAERNAVAMAVAAGHGGIEAVAVVGGKRRAAPPCGGCRQVLAEFARADVPVVYALPGGKGRTQTTVGELLPESFGAKDLKAGPARSTDKPR